jgi:hypothetical protein
MEINLNKVSVLTLGIALLGFSCNLSASDQNLGMKEDSRVQSSTMRCRVALDGPEPLFVNLFKVSGLSDCEGDHTWSNGKQVEMLIPLQHDRGRMTGIKFLNLVALPTQAQELQLLVNDHQVATYNFKAGEKRDIHIPLAAVKGDAINLKMRMPNARAYSNDDPRHLAFSFSMVELAFGQTETINNTTIARTLGVDESFLGIWIRDVRESKKTGDQRPIRVIIKALLDDNGLVGKWESLNPGQQNHFEELVDESKRPVAAFKLDDLPNIPELVNRGVIEKDGTRFHWYNVSAMGNNCGLNCLDIPRPEAKALLTQFKNRLGLHKLGRIRTGGMEPGQPDIDLDAELHNFTKPDAQIDAPLDAALLAYLAHEMGFNLRVYFGQPDIGYMVRDIDPENLRNPVTGQSLFNPAWPTLNMITLGAGHFNILTRTQGDELLRKYARVKEDLQEKGDVAAQQLFNLNGKAFEDENARIIKSQFVNDGKGGWMQAYMHSLKTRP